MQKFRKIIVSCNNFPFNRLFLGSLSTHQVDSESVKFYRFFALQMHFINLPQTPYFKGHHMQGHLVDPDED